MSACRQLNEMSTCRHLHIMSTPTPTIARADRNRVSNRRKASYSANEMWFHVKPYGQNVVSRGSSNLNVVSRETESVRTRVPFECPTRSNGRSFERRALLDSRIKKAAQGPPLQIGSIRCELSGRSFIPTSYLQPVSRREALVALLVWEAQRSAIASDFRRACLP